MKVTSVCDMRDGACDGDDEDDDGDGEDDDDEDHLEGDIRVRHGRLRIKVLEQQFDIRTAFSPVSRARTLHFIITGNFLLKLFLIPQLRFLSTKKYQAMSHTGGFVKAVLLISLPISIC